MKAVEVFVENTIIQIKLSPKEHSTTMKSDTKKPASHVLPMPLGLEEMIRNGYLPERPILTAVGPVPVKVPRVRNRNKLGVRFNSNLVPAYIRKSARMTAVIP